MTRIENHIIIEVSAQGLTLRKEVPDAWSGGNPLFHAKEARSVLDQVVAEMDALVAAHYGDIREREVDQESMESKNVRIPPRLWQNAMDKAALENTNVSEVIRKALTRYVN
ncbi:hypothetical protein [Arthrobacter roseus]|uniref:hypothetical protein n=1 Tax=Arthrobacter roseus TaxID=136274 RepID=UPI00196652FB|nr:hypothetical protein [Arthrobacter roseus]MBM7847445.1 hypothetical protein [Arthrobacter roseus]